MNKQEIEVQDPYFVQNEVAEKIIQLSGINVFQRSRKREIVEMRSLLFYILKNKLNMGLTEIARYFRESGTSINHATVIWSLKNYDIYKKTNKKLQEIEQMIVLKTSMNIFTEDKLDYYKIEQGIPKFKRYPKKAK